MQQFCHYIEIYKPFIESMKHEQGMGTDVRSKHLDTVMWQP